MTAPSAFVQPTPSSSGGSHRARWVVSVVLIWLGLIVALSAVMPLFMFTASVARTSGVVMLVAYALYVGGWLLLPTIAWRRAVSTVLAFVGLLLVMHTFAHPITGSAPFRGLDVAFGLVGGELTAIVHPLAAVMVLAAWFISRARSAWSYLLLPVVLVVHLVVTIVNGFAWVAPAGFLRDLIGSQPLTSPLLGLVYAIGPVVGWALLLGGAAWVSALLIDARWVPAITSRPARVPAAAPATAAAPVVGAQPAVSHTNTLAILALVFGIAGGVLGIIFGHLARAQIRRTGEEGWGMATAGLVLGYIGTSLSVIVLGLYVVFFVVLLS